MHFVGLEMVWDALLAPRLGPKMTQNWNDRVKWLRDPNTRGAPLIPFCSNIFDLKSVSTEFFDKYHIYPLVAKYCGSPESQLLEIQCNWG